jgi:hypothetical protein
MGVSGNWRLVFALDGADAVHVDLILLSRKISLGPNP